MTLNVTNGMQRQINLYEVSVIEVLALSCALVRAIDRHSPLAGILGFGAHAITDSRESAMIVANLAAIEYVEAPGIPEAEVLRMAESLLQALGVRTR